MPAARRPSPLLALCTTALILSVAGCAKPEPPKEEPKETAPPAAASKVPPICNPNSPCAGSTCQAAITAASATVPPDACPRYFENQADTDVFAWNSFIALNWPADTATCSAKTTASISDPGPRVWETYASPSDVFVAKGKPKAWCSDALRASLAGPRPFGQIAKAPHLLLASLHGMASLQGTAGLEGIDEAVGGVLTDQNRRFVRYEIHLNQDEYNYLTVPGNDLWQKSGQVGKTINFPQGPNDQPSRCGAQPCGPVGAMEIKSAWKVLSDTEKAAGNFYMTEGTVYNNAKGDKSPGKNPVTLGLVGLHILHKTEKEPFWFWATFEHVDNTTKSFFNPNCKDCKDNTQTAAKPPPPYTELLPNGQPINKPVQVVRTTPIEKNDAEAPPLNKYYQGLLRDAGSVFQNYELVSVQWAFGAAKDGFPPVLANTVLETYVQKTSSCMGCHKALARTAVGTPADFSFVLGAAH